MIINIFALALVAGVCSAFPHEDETTSMPLPGPVDPERSPYPEKGPYDPAQGPFDPAQGPFNPEQGPFDPEQGPFDPEKSPHPAENTVFPTEVPGKVPAPQDGSKSDSDLKTDATFWWPYSRSWSWGYPTYRTYWTYPTYRYYRPRTYYYYW